jgi:hypothetical protein
MNTSQIKRLQTITNQEWIEWKTCKHISGALTFNVTQIGDKVLVHASNTDTIEWWQKQVIIQIIVGSKGGLNKITVH